MKGIIAPSLLSFNHAEMRPRVVELVKAGAEVIHIDIMDGQFVPPISFGDSMVKGFSDIEGPLYEAHLMVKRPENQFERFAEAGCGRILFHAEATSHSHRLIQVLHEMNVEAGIVINPGTPVEMVREVVGIVDLVLVMTVNPGWGGQACIESTFEKVRTIRSWRADLNIEVDGGIDDRTLPLARAAGANLFVVGSHLLRYPSLTEAMREFSALCD